MDTTPMILAALFAAALAAPAAAQPAPRVFVMPALPPVAAVPALPDLPDLADLPDLSVLSNLGALSGLRAFPALPALPALRAFSGGWGRESADDRADDLYDRARDLIEQGKFDRAVADLDRLIALKSNRTDAAMYWKAYSLSKLGQRADALSQLGDLIKQFGDSRWLRDAKALEVEVRQASGQAVSPASQEDEELKLMALRGIMQSDPE